jgi:hypothetical protein
MEEKQTPPDFGPAHSDHSDRDTIRGEGESLSRIENERIDLEKLSSETGFEPIRSPADQRRLSIRTTSTLRRERSNNGYGCDDVEDEGADTGNDGSGVRADGANAEERDPFEVGWEGGDSDPLCPRSFPAWRKWLIVAITSVGSFCV